MLAKKLNKIEVLLELKLLMKLLKIIYNLNNCREIKAKINNKI